MINVLTIITALMVRTMNDSLIVTFRLEIVQIMFVIIGVVMGVFTILLLVFGFLATGATRQNVYSGAKCIMGGRISAAFVSILCVHGILGLCSSHHH